MNPRVPAGNYEVAHISYELNVHKITMKLTSSRKGETMGGACTKVLSALKMLQLMISRILSFRC
ncbi:hypothetical protein RND71_034927 [Anisodus tanguticus]|uniref:Uncharacterized protein n=1 Tax=Anisodus tanguticus TaxID=243964 RepID=A0AAE1R4I2_9SOLA|nr:hypothetical protein RND71_034927 [Anisodus tanguticus]